LKSESVFENGIQNGKTIVYFRDGKIQFEGEILYGQILNGKEKRYYKSGELKIEGEYLKGRLWNVKGYNIDGSIDFEIRDGKGIIKEYNYRDELSFEGEYLMDKKMEKEKNIIFMMEHYLLKENI